MRLPRAIEGGFVDEALVDITGGIGGEHVPLCPDADADALWEKLLSYTAAGYLLGAGSPSGSDTDVSAEGIVQVRTLRVVKRKRSHTQHTTKTKSHRHRRTHTNTQSEGRNTVLSSCFTCFVNTSTLRDRAG